MNFTYIGGTPKQVAWAKEGVSRCRYPLEEIAVNVFVQWVATTPASDASHSYMVSQGNSDGSFTMWISSWADDPSNPANQGLPDPASQLQGFYMESIVHEIGHIVSWSTFASEFQALVPADSPFTVQRGGIDLMCSLFWTAEVNSGTGIRYGTLADWRPAGKPWADLIIEAVAETFKCAFYGGELDYTNRTAWHVSEAQWAQFLSLLEPINVIKGFTWAVSGKGGAQGGHIDLVLVGRDVPVGGAPAVLSVVGRGEARADQLFGSPSSPGELTWEFTGQLSSMVQDPVTGLWAPATAYEDVVDSVTVTANTDVDRLTPGISASFSPGGIDPYVAVPQFHGRMTDTGSYYEAANYDVTIQWTVLGVPNTFFNVVAHIGLDPISFEPQERLSYTAHGGPSDGGTQWYGFQGSGGSTTWADDMPFSILLDLGKLPVSAPYPFLLIGNLAGGPGRRGQYLVAR